VLRNSLYSPPLPSTLHFPVFLSQVSLLEMTDGPPKTLLALLVFDSCPCAGSSFCPPFHLYPPYHRRSAFVRGRGNLLSESVRRHPLSCLIGSPLFIYSSWITAMFTVFLFSQLVPRLKGFSLISWSSSISWPCIPIPNSESLFCPRPPNFFPFSALLVESR